MPGKTRSGTAYKSGGSRSPTGHVSIEELIAEDDKVAARWRCDATHRGPLMGIPARQTRDLDARVASRRLSELTVSLDCADVASEANVDPGVRLDALYEVRRATPFWSSSYPRDDHLSVKLEKPHLQRHFVGSRRSPYIFHGGDDFCDPGRGAW
jgi:hypothetical protein